MSDSRPVLQPTIFILYGATGDLAHRLVLPAFYRLAIAGLLPKDWRLVANGRGDVSHEDFQEDVRKCLEEARQELGGQPQLIHYMAVPPSAFGSLTAAIG